MINRWHGSRASHPDRYPCPWCDEPKRWPDLCGESVAGCARKIERRCAVGDHRRCDVSACVVAARWQEDVRRAGADAGAPFAVVSTIFNRAEVVRTADTPDAARAELRSYALYDQEYMIMVYVVRGGDGALL